MDMASDGTLYVGNEGGPDAVKVWKIGPGGSPVVGFGNRGIADPDAVIVDSSGTVTSIPGSLLVGSSSEGICMVLPNGTVTTLFAPSTTIGNPDNFVFDNNGRLLWATWDAGAGISTIKEGKPVTLYSGPAGHRIAVDSLNRIVASVWSSTNVALISSSGLLLQPEYFHAILDSPLARGKGGYWGNDIYAVDPERRLIRVDATGKVTVMGSGFIADGAFLFTDDGALLVSEGPNNRILKVVPDNGPRLQITVASVDIQWESVSGLNYQVEYLSTLTTNRWTPLGSIIVGNGQTNFVTDDVRGNEKRFYRVVESP